MSKNTEALDRAKIAILARLAAGLDQGIGAVRDEAKELCPVDEGHLRAHIDSYVEDDEDAIRGRVGTDVHYAPYVHQGTGIYAVNGQGRKTPWKWYGEGVKYRGWHVAVGQRPQPFLKDALEQNIDQITERLTNIVRGITI